MIIFLIGSFFIYNKLASNLGVTVKPMDKLSITADLWWAKLAEDRIFSATVKDDSIGLETDLKITYQLVEGLSLVLSAHTFLQAMQHLLMERMIKTQWNSVHVFHSASNRTQVIV